MSTDILQSFIFENTDIRGAIVKLDTSFTALLENQTYTNAQQQLLAQFTIANLLMSSHIKFDGLLSLQARGSKQVSLIMTECTNQLQFRGIVRGEPHHSDTPFNQLFENGTLAITIEPTDGQRYQGIIPLEQHSLADCLAQYFQQSEQIRSWFYITQYQGEVAGLLLQALPASSNERRENSHDDWERVTTLAATLTDTELLQLSPEQVLYRLYHEEHVRIFTPRAVSFQCSCSKERMERALIGLGQYELTQILADEGKIDTQCHFCNKQYHFSRADILQLLQSSSSTH